MPQDGSMNYQYPPGTPGIPDTTIESESYNTFLDDLVVNDLNIARPIHRGGTGGITADAALTNLSAEKALQVVTNYDSMAWRAGSFYSAVGATGAPNAINRFAGIYYGNADDSYATLEARDETTGILYVKNKVAGVWGAWAQQVGPLADAAPFDAQAYNGIQINGSFEVSQERGTAVVSTSVYVMDGWILNRAGTSTTTFNQQPDTTTFSGFTNYLLGLVTVAQTSLGAGDYVVVVNMLEGYRVSRLAWGTASAKPITIGFWTSHARAGLYSGSVRNGGSTRSYVFTYTQNVSNVAQYNVVTIPGCPDGTWPKDNTLGMLIYFTMACGATLTAPTANTWLSGSYIAASGQVNAVAATSDVFRLAGVVVLPGTQAPTAAQSPLIMRPYGQELVTCQRYFQQRLDTMVSGYNAGGGAMYASLDLAPQMRAAPTLAFSGITYVNASGLAGASNPTSVRCFATLTGAGAAYATFNVNMDARL